jgi:hypothetical protein
MRFGFGVISDRYGLALFPLPNTALVCPLLLFVGIAGGVVWLGIGSRDALEPRRNTVSAIGVHESIGDSIINRGIPIILPGQTQDFALPSLARRATIPVTTHNHEIMPICLKLVDMPFDTRLSTSSAECHVNIFLQAPVPPGLINEPGHAFVGELVQRLLSSLA